MEIIFAMLIRGGLSFLVGVMLGFVSLALFSSIIPPDWVGRLNMITVAVGVSTGTCGVSIVVQARILAPRDSSRLHTGVWACDFGIAHGLLYRRRNRRRGSQR